jgi:hypothetical protein
MRKRWHKISEEIRVKSEEWEEESEEIRVKNEE